MELVFHVEKERYAELKEKLLKDEVASLASITFREASQLGGEEGYYCIVSGSEEKCERAREICKEFAKEIEGEEKERILKKIKEEEEAATSGLGAILG